MTAPSQPSVYAGIVYLPQHPQADLHGLIRGVVRTRGILRLKEILDRFDIPFHARMFQEGTWSESRSIAEIQAAQSHYGELLVCPLWCAYLGASYYQPAKEGLKMRAESAVVPHGPPESEVSG
jgi:hypothetical protein